MSALSITTHFNGFLLSESAVVAYVLRTRHSHPWGNDLLVFDNGAVKKVPRANLSDYVASASIDGVIATIHLMSGLGLFRTNYPFLGHYQLNLVVAGHAGQFSLGKGETRPTVMVGAKLSPTFFDAQILTATEIATYNRKDGVSGLCHSGDITYDGHFMHSIFVTGFVPKVYAVSAVGFHARPLVQYQKVCPFIVLVDHTAFVVHVVPFSLERASIADSTLIAPLLFHVSAEGRLRWYVPPSCMCDANVNTGVYSQRMKHSMRSATASFESEFGAAMMAQAPRASPPPSAMVSGAPPHGASDRSSPPPDKLANLREIVFVQDGLVAASECHSALAAGERRLIVGFGRSLVPCGESWPDRDASSPVLPILTGVAHGHPSLALGEAFRALCDDYGIDSAEAWQRVLVDCGVVVVHVYKPDDDKTWNEAVMVAATMRVLGIMVVHAPRNFSNAQSDLSDLNLCCSRLMGGLSAVLVRTPDRKVYFYRGAIGLVPVQFCDPSATGFGALVDLEQTLVHHRTRRLSWPVVQPASSKWVFLNAHDSFEVEAEEAAPFLGLCLEGGVKWTDAQAQLAMMLTALEMNAMKDGLTRLVLQQQEERTAEAASILSARVEDLKQALSSAPSDVDLAVHTKAARDAIRQQKHAIYTLQAPYREALGRIADMCSLKMVSVRKIGIQQAQRKATVAQNVERAKKMTAPQLAKELIETTDGFVVALVATQRASKLLSAISNNSMEAYLQTLAREPADAAMGFLKAPNCTLLDADSAEIMFEMQQPAEHVLSSSGTQLTFVMQDTPHLVLPLYRAAQKMDGERVDFMTEANLPHVANFRVLLRGMLSGLKRCPISASSPDLTIGIQVIVLSLMRSYACAVPDLGALDPSSSVCETLRGLLYLWGTFAGSGQRPSTFAFQLLQPVAKLEVPSKRGQWTLYALVAQLYPYTKLPLASFRSNIRVLLVKAIARKYVTPVVDAECKADKMRKATQARRRADGRNSALRWNYAACAILQETDPESDASASARSNGVFAAKTLLGHAPSMPTYTSTQLARWLALVAADRAAEVPWPVVRVAIACAIFKRSGCFSADKNERTLAALVLAKIRAYDRLHLELPDTVLLSAAERAEGDTALVHCGRLFRKGAEVHVYHRVQQQSTPSSPAASAPKVQNEKAYANADDSKMKGDAELRRIPWRVSAAPLADGLSNEDFLASMRNLTAKLVPAGMAPVPSHLANNDALAALWQGALDVPVSDYDALMPIPCLQALFGAIGVDAPNVSSTVGNVVRILVDDMNKTQDRALAYLKTWESSAEEREGTSSFSPQQAGRIPLVMD